MAVGWGCVSSSVGRIIGFLSLRGIGSLDDGVSPYDWDTTTA